jgi:hypothetical protein
LQAALMEIRGNAKTDIYWAYQALVNVNAEVRTATMEGLRDAGIYVAGRYARALPSRRAAQQVAYDINPPRVYIGVQRGGMGFIAHFFEAGAKRHTILPIKRQKHSVKMTINGQTKRVRKMREGWFKTRLALPGGGEGGVNFRTRVRHPGVPALHLLQRTGEQSVSAVADLLTASLQRHFG